MADTIYSVSYIRSVLQPVFSAYNVKRAVRFGSYARGLAANNSDVDILVDSGLTGLAFFGLLEDVAAALDKTVDLIDTSQIVPGSPIDKEISENGILIYEQKL